MWVIPPVCDSGIWSFCALRWELGLLLHAVVPLLFPVQYGGLWAELHLHPSIVFSFSKNNNEVNVGRHVCLNSFWKASWSRYFVQPEQIKDWANEACPLNMEMIVLPAVFLHNVWEKNIFFPPFISHRELQSRQMLQCRFWLLLLGPKTNSWFWHLFQLLYGEELAWEMHL